MDLGTSRVANALFYFYSHPASYRMDTFCRDHKIQQRCACCVGSAVCLLGYKSPRFHRHKKKKKKKKKKKILKMADEIGEDGDVTRGGGYAWEKAFDKSWSIRLSSGLSSIGSPPGRGRVREMGIESLSRWLSRMALGDWVMADPLPPSIHHSISRGRCGRGRVCQQRRNYCRRPRRRHAGKVWLAGKGVVARNLCPVTSPP